MRKALFTALAVIGAGFFAAPAFADPWFVPGMDVITTAPVYAHIAPDFKAPKRPTLGRHTYATVISCVKQAWCMLESQDPGHTNLGWVVTDYLLPYTPPGRTPAKPKVNR
jgi:hypothetical protein